MAIQISDSNHKRSCCRLIKELSKFTEADNLTDPLHVSRVLEILSQHCVLMKLMGESAVKWDLTKSQCYIAFYPDDAQEVINEISKTFAAYASLDQYGAILSHLMGLLAHNAKLKQFSDKLPFFLSQLREGEKKFGSVPMTSLLKENKTQHDLSASDLLKAHPLLDKPQFDGVPPKNNPNPIQNPEAAENTQQLQLQLQLQPTPKYTPAPTAAPKLRPF